MISEVTPVMDFYLTQSIKALVITLFTLKVLSTLLHIVMQLYSTELEITEEARVKNVNEDLFTALDMLPSKNLCWYSILDIDRLMSIGG